MNQEILSSLVAEIEIAKSEKENLINSLKLLNLAIEENKKIIAEDETRIASVREVLAGTKSDVEKLENIIARKNDKIRELDETILSKKTEAESASALAQKNIELAKELALDADAKREERRPIAIELENIKEEVAKYQASMNEVKAKLFQINEMILKESTSLSENINILLQ